MSSGPPPPGRPVDDDTAPASSTRGSAFAPAREAPAPAAASAAAGGAPATPASAGAASNPAPATPGSAGSSAASNPGPSTPGPAASAVGPSAGAASPPPPLVPAAPAVAPAAAVPTGPIGAVEINGGNPKYLLVSLSYNVPPNPTPDTIAQNIQLTVQSTTAGLKGFGERPDYRQVPGFTIGSNVPALPNFEVEHPFAYFYERSGVAAMNNSMLTKLFFAPRIGTPGSNAQISLPYKSGTIYPIGNAAFSFNSDTPIGYVSPDDDHRLALRLLTATPGVLNVSGTQINYPTNTEMIAVLKVAAPPAAAPGGATTAATAGAAVLPGGAATGQGGATAGAAGQGGATAATAAPSVGPAVLPVGPAAAPGSTAAPAAPPNPLFDQVGQFGSMIVERIQKIFKLRMKIETIVSDYNNSATTPETKKVLAAEAAAIVGIIDDEMITVEGALVEAEQIVDSVPIGTLGDVRRQLTDQIRVMQGHRDTLTAQADLARGILNGIQSVPSVIVDEDARADALEKLAGIDAELMTGPNVNTTSAEPIPARPVRGTRINAANAALERDIADAEAAVTDANTKYEELVTKVTAYNFDATAKPFLDNRASTLSTLRETILRLRGHMETRLAPSRIVLEERANDIKQLRTAVSNVRVDARGNKVLANVLDRLYGLANTYNTPVETEDDIERLRKIRVTGNPAVDSPKLLLIDQLTQKGQELTAAIAAGADPAAGAAPLTPAAGAAGLTPAAGAAGLTPAAGAAALTPAAAAPLTPAAGAAALTPAAAAPAGLTPAALTPAGLTPAAAAPAAGAAPLTPAGLTPAAAPLILPPAGAGSSTSTLPPDAAPPSADTNAQAEELIRDITSITKNTPTGFSRPETFQELNRAYQNLLDMGYGKQKEQASAGVVSSIPPLDSNVINGISQAKIALEKFKKEDEDSSQSLALMAALNTATDPSRVQQYINDLNRIKEETTSDLIKNFIDTYLRTRQSNVVVPPQPGSGSLAVGSSTAASEAPATNVASTGIQPPNLAPAGASGIGIGLAPPAAAGVAGSESSGAGPSIQSSPAQTAAAVEKTEARARQDAEAAAAAAAASNATPTSGVNSNVLPPSLTAAEPVGVPGSAATGVQSPASVTLIPSPSPAAANTTSAAPNTNVKCEQKTTIKEASVRSVVDHIEKYIREKTPVGNNAPVDQSLLEKALKNILPKPPISIDIVNPQQRENTNIYDKFGETCVGSHAITVEFNNKKNWKNTSIVLSGGGNRYNQPNLFRTFVFLIALPNTELKPYTPKNYETSATKKVLGGTKNGTLKRNRAGGSNHVRRLHTRTKRP